MWYWRSLCAQVETLKMGWCHLGPDDGAKAVADLLMFNSTLVVLDLRGNGLGNAGAPLYYYCAVVHPASCPTTACLHARPLGSAQAKRRPLNWPASAHLPSSEKFDRQGTREMVLCMQRQ
jgi:hypothetical protein